MTITIRPYAPPDLDACRALWRELVQRHRDIYASESIGGDHPERGFDEYLSNGEREGSWVVVDEAGEVVALGGLLLRGREAEIEPIVVRATHRSRGIGARLLEHLKAEARALGVRHLSIRPVARNVEAIACFHRAGFTTLGHLDMFLKLSDDGEQRWKPGVEIHGLAFRY